MAGNFMASAINAVIQAAQAGISIVNQAIGSGAIQKLFSAIAQGLPSVAKIGIDAIKKGSEFFTNVISNVSGGNIINIGAQVVQKVSDTVQKILPNISALKNIDFSQMAQAGFSLFNGERSDNLLVNIFKDTAKEMLNPINVASSLADKIRDKLENLNLPDSITRVNLDEINIFGETLGEKFQSIQARFQNFLGNLGILNEEGNLGGLTGIIDKLKSTFSSFTDKIPGFNEFLNKVTGGTSETDKKIGDRFDDGVIKEITTDADGNQNYVIERDDGTRHIDVIEGTVNNSDGSISYEVFGSNGKRYLVKANDVVGTGTTNHGYEFTLHDDGTKQYMTFDGDKLPNIYDKNGKVVGSALAIDDTKGIQRQRADGKIEWLSLDDYNIRSEDIGKSDNFEYANQKSPSFLDRAEKLFGFNSESSDQTQQPSGFSGLLDSLKDSFGNIFGTKTDESAPMTDPGINNDVKAQTYTPPNNDTRTASMSYTPPTSNGSGTYNPDMSKYSGSTQCVTSARGWYEDYWGQTLPMLGDGQPARTMVDKVAYNSQYEVSDYPTVGAAVVMQPGIEGAGSSGHMGVVVKDNGNGTCDIAETHYSGKKQIRTISYTGEGDMIFITPAGQAAQQYA